MISLVLSRCRRRPPVVLSKTNGGKKRIQGTPYRFSFLLQFVHLFNGTCRRKKNLITEIYREKRRNFRHHRWRHASPDDAFLVVWSLRSIRNNFGRYCFERGYLFLYI